MNVNQRIRIRDYDKFSLVMEFILGLIQFPLFSQPQKTLLTSKSAQKWLEKNHFV